MKKRVTTIILGIGRLKVPTGLCSHKKARQYTSPCRFKEYPQYCLPPVNSSKTTCCLCIGPSIWCMTLSNSLHLLVLCILVLMGPILLFF